MAEEDSFKKVYIDFTSNQPDSDKTRTNFRDMLTQQFEKRVDESVERMATLPPLAIEPEGEYLALLLEARELFVDGRFYSCVAMCGIVGERLIKDLLRISVLINDSGSAKVPSDQAFDQLERVEVYALVNFLKSASVLSEDAAQAAAKLSELRNTYAHSRGKAPKSDALKAITHLHAIVEGTVSVFKQFEIKDGVLVPKEARMPAARAPSIGK